MTRRLVVRSAARADILEQFAYVLEEGSGAPAARFLDAVEAAARRILEMPGDGTPKELDNPRLWGGFSVVDSL